MNQEQTRAINAKIYHRVSGDQTVHRKRGLMLKYALDSELLSDADYNEIINSESPFLLLISCPWLLGLVWARCQYERGDGKNFKQALEESIGLDRSTLEQLIQALANVWKFPLDLGAAATSVSRDQFLSECWLICGDQEQNLGRTSQIWRTLSAVVPELPDDFDKDDLALAFARLDSESDSIPAFFRHLASNGHTDFIESVRALKTGTGDGWLGVVAGNPHWRTLVAQDHATASWGIWKSGNWASWAIRLGHIRLGANRRVIVKQSGRELFECHAVGDQLILDPSQFRPEFDSKMRLSIQVGHYSVLLEAPFNEDWNSPVLFRQSPHSSFHRLIKATAVGEGTRVVQASSLFVIVPPEAGQNEFCYGNAKLRSTWVAAIEASSFFKAALHQLDLSLVDRSKPMELQWGEQVLLRVGGTPSFTLDNADPNCVIRDEPEISVVFGEQSGVTLDHYSGELARGRWTAVNAELELSPEKSIIKRGAFGQRGQIRFAAAQATPCVCRFRFLPASLRAALLSATPVMGDDWKWLPEADDYRRSEAAKEGRLRGQVMLGADDTIELEVKADRTLWWFSRGRDSLPESFCDELCAQTLADLKGIFLDVHKPFGVSAVLKLGEGILYEFHDGLNRVRPYELMAGKCDWSSLFEQSSQLSLTVGAESQVLTRFKVTPPETMLIKAGDGVKLFLVDGDLAERYRVLIVGESSLLHGNVVTVKLEEPDVDGLRGFDLPSFHKHEAAWVFLTERSPNDELLDKTLGFCWNYKDETLVPGRVAQVETGGDVLTFPLLVSAWNIDRDLTAEQRKHIGGAMGLISSGKGTLLRKIFARYLAEADLRDLITNRGAADEVFGRFLEGVFDPDQLDAQLSDLLRIGFNWLAEPDWLTGKEELIRTKLCDERQRCSYSGRFTANGKPVFSKEILRNKRNFSKILRTQLHSACPLLAAVTDIESGFPFRTKLNEIRVSELKSVIKLVFDAVHPAFDPQVFEVHRDNVMVGLHGIYPEGLKVHGDYSSKALSFFYHQDIQVEFIRPERQLLRVRVKNKQAAHAFFVDRMGNLEESLIQSSDAANDLQHLFAAIVNASAEAIGSHEARGLGFLFATCSGAFKALAEEDPTQRNRHFIFQVAVINVLNRWMGWNSQPFPEAWPLHDRSRYQLLCALNYRIWTQPIAKKTLMQDMIPIEWLLAWFHY